MNTIVVVFLKLVIFLFQPQGIIGRIGTNLPVKGKVVTNNANISISSLLKWRR